ncbi:MAG: hypothetical protein NTZ37_05275 [Methanoregula sp.]|jgi:hypothetical protein|nr:hypothetical protein [Methanoregula sp.]
MGTGGSLRSSRHQFPGPCALAYSAATSSEPDAAQIGFAGGQRTGGKGK